MPMWFRHPTATPAVLHPFRAFPTRVDRNPPPAGADAALGAMRIMRGHLCFLNRGEVRRGVLEVLFNVVPRVRIQRVDGK